MQTTDSCRVLPQGGNCAWYSECLEESHLCCKLGYPFGFADASCSALAAVFENNNGGDGEAWFCATTACLQTALVADLPKGATTCEGLWNKAFDYAKACFARNGGKSLRRLSLLDAWSATVARSTAEFAI